MREKKKIAKATDGQIGGEHYLDMPIQPGIFCETNGLTHFESNIVKRICRWRKKGGLEDLMKARHEIDLIIEVHKPSVEGVDPLKGSTIEALVGNKIN